MVAKNTLSNYDAIRTHFHLHTTLTTLLNRPLVYALMCSLLLLTTLATPSMAQEEMHPFSTDGCSLFPDRSQLSKTDWCGCCIQHDFAYWRGGSAETRLRADEELSACILRATGNKALAELMFSGVRTGGGPYFYTSYRWGYGWAYGKVYAELTPEETAQADRLEMEYRDKHPTLMCPE